ncbi:MAG TPA: protoporphyrinogen oxidase, partial [Candidatus Methylomirabilis sp.]|nr:protoporphyrinogen oxidase [Candidatus Methylomirabilis sp.]
MLRYLDPSLSHLLDGIASASSATATLAYRRVDIAHPLDGFGFVVPRTERRPITAGTFSSVKYPGRAPEGHVLIRVFLGGALDEAVLEQSDDALAATARAQLAELIGARGEPLFTRVVRHPRAMPQYHVGHLARVEAIEQSVRRHRGLALAGAAYRGVGIADCVHSGEEAVEKLLG